MKIVVTGGAGFIGANLCRRLADDPQVDELVAIDDLSTGFATNLDGSGAHLIVGSILDRALLRDIVDGADAVVHLAARPSVPRSVVDPVTSHEVNATGTIQVLEECRRAGARIVLASSSSVYGESPTLPKHEDLPARPRSPYAASKLAAESYALAYAHTYGLSTLALRFFNVYGPLQAAGHAYAAVVPTYVDAALRGQPLPVYGDGAQTRDFTYVGTVAEVLAHAAIAGLASDHPVNLAFGTRTSIVELIGLMRELLDLPVHAVNQPPRPGEVQHSQACDRRLHALFPDLEPVPLTVGLSHTIAWFRGLPPASHATPQVPVPAQSAKPLPIQ